MIVVAEMEWGGVRSVSFRRISTCKDQEMKEDVTP